MCVYAYASDFVRAYVSPITGCFYWQASAPISWRQIFGADFVLPGCQPRTLVAAALGPIVLEGVSPKLWLPDLWGQFVFGRCQPQTLAAGSLGPVCFLDGVRHKLLLPDLWGQFAFWVSQCPPQNSCCRISGASLFLKGVSPKLLCCRMIWCQLCFLEGAAPSAAG